MIQKVFILENFVASNLGGSDDLIINYWGSLARSIKFLAHPTYLHRLASKTGYFAFKVTRIYDQDQVDGRWISFDKSKIPSINNSSSKARYFVLKKEALDGIIDIDPNANCIGTEIGIAHIGIKKVYSLIIGAGAFIYSGGGGGTTPGAGAKVP